MLNGLYDAIAGDGIDYSDIVVPVNQAVVLVSEDSNVHCYLDVIFQSQNKLPELTGFPVQFEGERFAKAIDDAHVRCLLQLSQGRPLFVLPDEVSQSQKYKLLPCHFRFPTGDPAYKVILTEPVLENYQRDLECELFGLSYDELAQILKALNSFTFPDYARYGYDKIPRMTRSPKSNYCEINGTWIPPRFPYITFSDASYGLSYVSLLALYRHLQILLMSEAIQGMFNDHGIFDKTIKQIYSITCERHSKRTLTTDRLVSQMLT